MIPGPKGVGDIVKENVKSVRDFGFPERTRQMMGKRYDNGRHNESSKKTSSNLSILLISGLARFSFRLKY